MKQTELLQEVRLMKFEEFYSRRQDRRLTQGQAAEEILGVSVRTFRRWEDRYEMDGAAGLYDRRLGKLANNRVPTDTVMEVLELFDTQYWDYTPKHFHEKLVAGHGFTRSYNWVRLTLQSHGRVQPAPRRGAHRRKRPRRPMIGIKQRKIKVVGARGNNLKKVDSEILLGTFTAVIGVSGGGKSTFLIETRTK